MSLYHLPNVLSRYSDTAVFCFFMYILADLAVVSIIPLVVLVALNPSHKALGVSPSFELQELINENHNWVQTYGKSESHLRSNYTDISG